MSITHGFDTSWGAILTPEGCRFRIWGSPQTSIKLRVNGQTLESSRDQDGWLGWVVPDVTEGTPYCFVVNDNLECPDPASRAQVDGVTGHSLVVNPHAYKWIHKDWQGRPWEETVYYELHIGTFTPEGSFAAAIKKLPFLRDLGITAIEIMPVGQFGGERGWGYDGVLIYAPQRSYGTPEDMKAFIDAAHGLGLGAKRLKLVQRLLQIRHERIVPLLSDARGYAGKIEQAEDGVISVSWRLADSVLHMAVNLDGSLRPAVGITGEVIYGSSPEAIHALAELGELPAHQIVVALENLDQRLIVPPQD